MGTALIQRAQASDSASTGANASRDGGPGVEATLKDRVLHERELCALRFLSSEKVMNMDYQEMK